MGRQIPRDERFLEWAARGAELFSTCAKRQHMAIIVDTYGRVVGTGYNGSPPGMPHCVDGACPRLAEDTASGSPYTNCIAVHAEQNALLFSDHSLRNGGTIYITGPPCWECARALAGSGLTRVVFRSDRGFGGWARSVELLESVGLDVVERP